MNLSQLPSRNAHSNVRGQRPLKRFPSVAVVARGSADQPSIREHAVQQHKLRYIQHEAASRRSLLLGGLSMLGYLGMQGPAALADESPSIAELQDMAFESYANREFATTIDLLNQIIAQDANSSQWYEMRATVHVDNKSFDRGLDDYNKAIALTDPELPLDVARLLAGRALAYEGLSDWRAALRDYNTALDTASAAGKKPDPYVLNSRGNCHNSLGEWAEARADYQASSELFQRAKGFRGRGGSTTMRLDGAIFAASNAALMLAQMGDEDGAVKEMQNVARRAPGSADMRAALAALYWSRGQQGPAEEQWEFACDQITVGCRKYADSDWLRRIRRWPPVMVARMQDFLRLRAPAGEGLQG